METVLDTVLDNNPYRDMEPELKGLAKQNKGQVVVKRWAPAAGKVAVVLAKWVRHAPKYGLLVPSVCASVCALICSEF